MRIADAIIQVLTQSGPMTCNEVYDKIIENNLYEFGAKDPLAAMRAKLRCHCGGLDFPSASPVKYFKIIGLKENKHLYDLIDNNEIFPLNTDEIISDNELLPEENIEKCYNDYINTVRIKLLELVSNCHPSFFERLVVVLLLKMGYGYDDTAGKCLGKSHDGGIDGVIYEDKLELDKIYIQAKRYDKANTIGRETIQSFIGAMQNVQKGVFITTSSFSKYALDFANNQQQKNLRLINGEMLVDLMIRHNVGLEPIQEYKVYRIDENYFE